MFSLLNVQSCSQTTFCPRETREQLGLEMALALLLCYTSCFWYGASLVQ